MTTLKNMRPNPITPTDPGGFAAWLDANGPVRDYKPIPEITMSAADWHAAGVDLLRPRGEPVLSRAQRDVLADAAYKNGGKLTGAEAKAALLADRSAQADAAQAAYDTFKTAIANAGAGLADLRDAVSVAAAELSGLPENASDTARNAAEAGLRAARSALETAQAAAESEYDAALAGLRKVRAYGYPPDDVMAAKHAARDRLANGDVRRWEQTRKRGR